MSLGARESPFPFRVLADRRALPLLRAPGAARLARSRWRRSSRTRRRDYRKANHHCWAYRLRDASGTVVEASKDDGEVGHPGRVLLELLRKHDLEGVLVVSRIFGGVKLGVGGVSRAFRDAGQGAINKALGSGL